MNNSPTSKKNPKGLTQTLSLDVKKKTISSSMQTLCCQFKERDPKNCIGSYRSNPIGRKASDIETMMNQRSSSIPRPLFKSITFECRKEFSNWKYLSNQHDITIYFADSGTASQLEINKYSNGLIYSFIIL